MALDCELSDFTKNEMKKFIEERRKHLHKNQMTEPVIEEMDELIDNFAKLNFCDVKQMSKSKGKAKSTRKPTNRNIWIGHCMRKPDNGGLGKDMKTCSDIFKAEGEDTLFKKYSLEKVS